MKINHIDSKKRSKFVSVELHVQIVWNVNILAWSNQIVNNYVNILAHNPTML